MRFILKKQGKPIRVIVLTALFLIGTAFASWALGYGQNNNSDGLVMDIDFSAENYDSGTRTFRDKSGNNNHAVSTNAAAFAPDKDGKSNGAMRFDGVSDQAVTPYDFSAQQDVTYSVWFNRLGSTGVRTLIGSEVDNGTIRLSNSSLQGYWDPTTNSFSSPSTLNGQQWYHLVVVKTANQLNFYLNGAYIWNVSVNDIAINNVEIGHQGTRVDRYWAGLISNVRVYNRAFSAAEILKLYNDFKPKFQVSSVEKGLIGHWPLNESNLDASGRVTDLSAYGNHGVNTGAVVANDRAGNPGGAMHFNGIDNKIAISYPNPIKQTSVVAWFRSTGEPAGGYHIITGASAVEISIYTTGHLRTGVVTDTQARKVFNSGSGLTDGKWHMVALTYDGINLKSWIDGVVTATNPVSGNLTGIAREIGRYQSNSYVANGDLSDVRIYNRALSEEEMSLLYNKYSPPLAADSLEKGLVLDVPLTSKYTKGGSAGAEVLTDLSPFSRNGQNIGAVLTSEGAEFDGVNDVIRFGTGNDFLPLPKLSISLWFRSKGTVPTTGTAPGLFGFTYGVRALLAGGGVMQFGLDDMTTFRYVTSSSNSYNYIDSKWHHFVGTNDGTNSYLYIDGTLISQGPVAWTGITRYMTNTFQLGRDNNDAHYFFYGTLNNLRIYNRTLSAQEVKTLYDRGRGNNGAVLNGL